MSPNLALRRTVRIAHDIHPLPDSVAWSPLVGHPLVRRTWVVWPPNSRRRDIGQLVTAFEVPPLM